MSKASQSQNDAIDNAITAQNTDQLRAAILAKAPASSHTLARAIATGNREITRLAIIAVTRERAIPSPGDQLRIRAFIAHEELAPTHPLRAPLKQITQMGAAGLSSDQLIIFNEHISSAALHTELPASAQRFLTCHGEQVTLESAHRISLKRLIIQRSFPQSLSRIFADKIADHLTLIDLAPAVNSNRETRELTQHMQASFRQMVIDSRDEKSTNITER